MRRIASILAQEAYAVERHVLRLRATWSATRNANLDEKERSIIRLVSLIRSAERHADRLRRDAAWFRGGKE